MKITKAIFGVDDSYFLEFWPIQAKICKELLGVEPILFYICNEDSDFYHDGNGMVKKIKKVKNNIINFFIFHLFIFLDNYIIYKIEIKTCMYIM